VCFTITAKVLETAAFKPETEPVAVKSPKKSPTPSDSSSLALSTQAHASPATSLTLSTSAEPETADDGYILLDECFSGTSSVSLKMSTSSGTPSPGNTLSSRNAVSPSADYQNVDGDSKTADDLPPRYESPQSPFSSDMHAERSMDNIFEGGPVVPECDDDSTTVGIWDSHSVVKSSNGELPPALPVKMTMSVAVPDVEYDVPLTGLGHGSAPHPTASPMHGSAAPPPQPHMVVPPTHMHRYVNTAPAFVRSQTPTSSATVWQNYTEPPSSGQQNYVECVPPHRVQSSQPSTRPAQNAATASSSLLPPKAHG